FLPVWTKRLLPFGRKVLVLRQDVLNRVLINRHRLLAAVVFDSPEPVGAAAEVVYVAPFQLALELFVARKAPVRRKRQKVRFNALKIAILVKRASEGGKGLIERVRRNTANSAAEHVGLDKPHGAEQVLFRQQTLPVVIVEFEQ